MDIKEKKFRSSNFPQLKQGKVYLDNAGSALPTKIQLENYNKDLLNSLYGNPHSVGNSSSTECYEVIEQVRLDVMNFFGVDAKDHVIFTSGATESCRLVAEMFEKKAGSFSYLQDNHTSVVGLRENLKQCSDIYCFSINSDSLAPDYLNINCYAATNISQKSIPSQALSNNLFAYPAQSNFNGIKYPVKWIKEVHNGVLNKKLSLTNVDNNFVLIDVASLVSTSPFKFSESEADFACLSFYKVFGFPTGLGALFVSDRVKNKLKLTSMNSYFGGGSVDAYLPNIDFHKPSSNFASVFERGTANFHGILGLKHGIDSFNQVFKSLETVQYKTFQLSKFLFQSMKLLKHYNNKPVVKLYCSSEFESKGVQGPIICFNVYDSMSKPIGCNHVMKLAATYMVEMRSGCFCNVGACMAMLSINSDVMMSLYNKGHRCSGDFDIVNGKPVGALRVSLGYHSSVEDVEKFLKFLNDCFTQKTKKEINLDVTLKKVLQPTVIKLIIYPVKSCKGVEVDNWKFDRKGGFYLDRKWMLIDSHGVCMSLKRHPFLLRIQPMITSDNQLMLTAESQENILIKEQSFQTESKQINICGDKVNILVCNESKVGLWLDTVLETSNVKLACISREHPCKEVLESRCSLVNQAQFLMLNKESIDKFCEALDDESINTDELIARFRCNIVVNGIGAFSEESLIKMYNSNGTVFEFDGPCYRCSAISVNPTDGSRNNRLLKNLQFLPSLLNKNTPRNSFGVYLKSIGNFGKKKLRVGEVFSAEIL